MNNETRKILLAVLRVFVGDVNRGHDSTLHAQEITNQVCRALHRKKEKEKKKIGRPRSSRRLGNSFSIRASRMSPWRALRKRRN